MHPGSLPIGFVPGSEWFHTLLCDLHHQYSGYVTKGLAPNDGREVPMAVRLEVGIPRFHPSAVWIVLSRAVRVNGFSSSVTPRFNTSRSAISSPV